MALKVVDGEGNERREGSDVMDITPDIAAKFLAKKYQKQAGAPQASLDVRS